MEVKYACDSSAWTLLSLGVKSERSGFRWHVFLSVQLCAVCRWHLLGVTELLTEGVRLLQHVSDVAAGHKVAGNSCELYYKEIKLLVWNKDDNAFLKQDIFLSFWNRFSKSLAIPEIKPIEVLLKWFQMQDKNIVKNNKNLTKLEKYRDNSERFFLFFFTCN